MNERVLPKLNVPQTADGDMDVMAIIERGQVLADKMPGIDYEEWETVRLLVYALGKRDTSFTLTRTSMEWKKRKLKRAEDVLRAIRAKITSGSSFQLAPTIFKMIEDHEFSSPTEPEE